VNTAEITGQQVRRSTAMDGLARLGPLARALIYLLLGGLTFAIAFGDRGTEADQRGAFQDLAAQTGGLVVLGLIAIGLVAYSLWRLAEAAFGVAGDGRRAGPRLLSLGRAIIYGFLAATAFSVIAGRHENQAERSRDLSARLIVTLTGVLVVDAAVRFDPAKASGVDAAIRTLAQQPLGQALLVVAAVGLVAFGAYGIAEARWHVT
jgi:hypothetical protein